MTRIFNQNALSEATQANFSLQATNYNHRKNEYGTDNMEIQDSH